MEKVTSLPQREKPSPIKNFLNKPMHDMTVGDSLILHAGHALVYAVVITSWNGLVTIIREVGKTPK